MTSLEETLPALTSAVPEIPARLAGLVQDGKDLEKAAGRLSDEVAEALGEATEAVGRVEQGLAEMESEVSARRVGLEERVRALEAGAAEVEARLRAAGEQLGRVGDAATTALQGVREEAAATRDAAHTAQEGCEAAIDELGSALERGRGELAEAAAAAAAEAGSLRQAVAEARGQVSQAVGWLRAEMLRLLDQARQEVRNTEQTLRAALHAQEDHLAEQTGRLEAGRQELFAGLEDRVATELRGRIGAVAAGVVQALSALGESAAGIAAEAAEGREALEARLEALDEAMGPMPAAIEAVKIAAQEIGLTWG